MELILTTPEDLRRLVQEEIARFERQESEAQARTHDPLAKEWLTNNEAMDFLGLSRSTMARYRKNGILLFTQIKTNIYYRRSDLIELLEKGLRTHSREEADRRGGRRASPGSVSLGRERSVTTWLRGSCFGRGYD